MSVQIIATIITTLFETAFYCGVVFGWSFISPILINEGYFFENCHNKSTVREECDLQKDSLSLIFSISTGLSLIISFIPGFLMDKYGIWFTRTLMLSMIGAGFLLAAIAKPSISSFLLFVAFPLISFGGVGVLVTNLAIAGFSEGCKGSIINLICGSMNSSSIVFLIVKSLYRLDFKLNHMFYFLSIFSLLFHFRTFLLMPKKTLPSEFPSRYKYGYKELSCFTEKLRKKVKSENEKTLNSRAGLLSQNSLIYSLKKLKFWSNVYFTCLIKLILMFFIGNFNFWIKTKLNNEHQITTYTTIFGIQLCSEIIFSPIGGAIIDLILKFYKKKMNFMMAKVKAVAIAQLVCNFTLVLALALSIVPNSKVQLLTFLLISFTRALFYGTTTSFINMCLPTEHFGSLYSITTGLSGLFLLLQYPINLFLSHVLNNNLIFLYSGFLLLSFSTLIHPLYLFRVVKSETKKLVALNNAVIEIDPSIDSCLLEADQN